MKSIYLSKESRAQIQVATNLCFEGHKERQGLLSKKKKKGKDKCSSHSGPLQLKIAGY